VADIRVLVVDDHPVVRQGLRSFLDVQPDITVVGEAADGAACVAAAEELRPDVILLDLRMPDADGLAALRGLREHEKRHYEAIRRAITPERVQAWFGDMVSGEVTRYELPRLGALNFVMSGALGGGVTRSLAQDAHGKSLSSLMLTIEI